MADKRISQLVDRGTVVNNDVIPIVVSGATTTNKATISSIQTFMQGNLDVGVTSVGITVGSSGTDVNVSGSPVTSSGNITINIPSASATNRGLVTTGSQTIAGAKTFSSDLIVNGITVGKGGASNVNNTAVGTGALSANTTGSSNTATGLSALLVNTGGNGNTANGYLSLQSNTTGGYNVSVGNQSMYSNSTGSNNTAVGNDSLYSNITGGKNTGIGSGAGYYIADGSTPNTTSDFSIYLGADTKASADNAQNEIVIGYNAIGNGSNTVTIGNSSVTQNYFTGNVRGLSFQVEAAGTANPIIIRNTSGTSSTTSNTNVIGFNSVNNIFVTTHSRGGFILGFNNSVSNREYTLPDASGTVALTTDLGAYLPLAGGTLTGALNGTSASFSGLTSVSRAGVSRQIFIERTGSSVGGAYLGADVNGFFIGDASTSVFLVNPTNGNTTTGSLNGTSASFSTEVTSSGGQGRFGGWATGAGYQGNALEVGVSGGNAFMIGYNRTSGSYIPLSIGGTTNQTTTIGGSTILFQNNGVTALAIASTGAATFSSSVSVKGGLTIVRSNTSESSIISNEGNLIYNARDNFNHVFQSNGSEVARINTTGAATFSSSVSGTSIRSSAVGSFGFNTANNGEFQIYATAANGMIMAGRGSSTDMVITNKSGSDVFTIPTGTTIANFTGNVGIGTASPSDKLEVQDGYLNIYHAANAATAGYGLQFLTNGGGSKNTIGTILISQVGTARSGDLLFLTSNASAPAERVRITSSGALQLNVDSSGVSLLKTNTSNSVLVLLPNTDLVDNVPRIEMLGTGRSSEANTIFYRANTQIFTAASASTERMRINSGGDLYIGSASVTASNTSLYFFKSSGLITQVFAYSSGTSVIQEFYRQGAGQVGSISYNGTATLYNSTSDYRLKEDLQDYNGLEIVSKLKTYDFNWKDADVRDYGMIAHELQEVLPNYVSGEKDAVDVDGNVKPQGVDYSKIVPILIKAIQEQQEQINQLKNQIK